SLSPPPVLVTHLRIGGPCTGSGCLDKHSIVWDAAPGGGPYDILFGDLQALHASGFAASVGGCLGEDLPNPVSDDSDTPALGQGFWYLSRGPGACPGQTGSYDEGGAQVLPRDPFVPQALDCRRP